MKEELHTWFHDDITFCLNPCDNTECFRNIKNKSDDTNVYSAAIFEGTDECIKAQ